MQNAKYKRMQRAMWVLLAVYMLTVIVYAVAVMFPGFSVPLFLKIMLFRALPVVAVFGISYFVRQSSDSGRIKSGWIMLMAFIILIMLNLIYLTTAYIDVSVSDEWVLMLSFIHTIDGLSLLANYMVMVAMIIIEGLLYNAWKSGDVSSVQEVVGSDDPSSDGEEMNGIALPAETSKRKKSVVEIIMWVLVGLYGVIIIGCATQSYSLMGDASIYIVKGLFIVNVVAWHIGIVRMKQVSSAQSVAAYIILMIFTNVITLGFGFIFDFSMMFVSYYSYSWAQVLLAVSLIICYCTHIYVAFAQGHMVYSKYKIWKKQNGLLDTIDTK